MGLHTCVQVLHAVDCPILTSMSAGLIHEERYNGEHRSRSVSEYPYNDMGHCQRQLAPIKVREPRVTQE